MKKESTSQKLNRIGNTTMLLLNTELKQAIDQARAAGITRAEVALVVEQTLVSAGYQAKVKP